MKSSTHAGFDQDHNAQVAVDQGSLLIVGCALSNYPNDSQEAEPTLSAIPSAIGTPAAAALDAGHFGSATLLPVPSVGLSHTSQRAVIPIIPVGSSVLLRYLIFHSMTQAPGENGVQTQDRSGQSDQRGAQMPVELVIGILKEMLGFRQFSLRGVQAAAAGEWCLVCLAFNLKRLHTYLGYSAGAMASFQPEQDSMTDHVLPVSKLC